MRGFQTPVHFIISPLVKKKMHLPNMSGACFKIFITEFAKVHPEQLMIMDNAGRHHVKWEDVGGQKPAINIAYLSY